MLAATAVLAAALVWWGSPASADRIRDLQWHLQYLDIARAHELSLGDGIRIAVIDTGVDATHPDLTGNVLPGVDAWALTHGQDPGDGWTDSEGHGTAMAGLIAAHGHGRGNAAGALGIAPMARIIPIRIELGGGGPDFYNEMTVAIKEALKLGADIISLSVTGPLGDQIKPVFDAGKIVVVAGGNVPDTEVVTATPGSVSVGAVRSDGLVADVSVRGTAAPPPLDQLALGTTAGAGLIWLTAPGEDVTIPLPHGAYGVGTGTSASTAIVSGAAALVWSRYPELTGEEVVRHLLATTTDKGAPGPDVEYGYGDLDVVRALETAPVPPTTTSSTVPTTACDPCTPTTGATGAAARAPEGSGGGSGPGETELVVAFGAILAAGCLALARWRGHRDRPAAAGGPGPELYPGMLASGPLPLPVSHDAAPRARRTRSGITLTATMVVIVMVALVGGCYASVH
ncbi:MAG TPA: S8 family serine peptidase [Acidimicrobiales bacterium]